MNVSVTNKGVKLDEKSLGILYKGLDKIQNMLPNMSPELLSVNFFIKKGDEKYHLKSEKLRKTRTYFQSKLSLVQYEGWVRLILPKKALYSHFQGTTIENSVRAALRNIFRELKKYKDLHYKSQSQYPNKLSIRKKG